jgi:topoisomerase-4 subunit A
MAKTKAAPPPNGGDINVVSLADALSERYLSYALSTIMARSLPDVRDGLKPVHRRLLYAMRQLHLDPGSGFKKSARVVGDVMGKFHPHGDASIYDAMVRLAQEFAQRYPMVDGQGNFGNIDGDNPAAMRYTEARLTEVAALMLEGINEDAVDFRPTYDGEGSEPLVLPGAFPNLLANGAQGIAVGMATSIPPHNIAEICNAALHLIKFPKATVAKLVEMVPGPDFPTGGILVEDPAAILEAYRTGRGSFRLRAKWTIENLKGGTWQAVITEIPYQVPKSRLIEKIADLLQQKKLPLLDDVHDESTTDVRIVLEPKSRNVEADHLMEQLFRQTDLEIRFGLNMNVLAADQTPRVMSLPEVLRAFLDHRREVLLRRGRFRLADIERRLEVLGGLLIAYLNIDEVIRIIRREDDPKAKMMKKWGLTEIQADAILNMKLKALRKLEEIEIRKENDDLTAERKTLKGLLKDEDKQWERVATEIKEIKTRFEKTPLGRRRTLLGTAPADVEIPMEAMVEREPVTLVCSAKGWVRALKGHVAADDEIKFKEGDRPRFHLHAETTDKLIVFGTNGRFYTIGIDKLPGGRGYGEPLKLMIDLGEQDPVGMFVHKPGRKLIVASTAGRGFIAPEEEVIAQTRAGKQVLNLAEGEEAAACAFVEEGDDHVAVIGDNRKLLLFPLSELPEMTRGRGVILQKYKDGGLSDVKSFRLKEGLTWRSGDRTRTETSLRDWVGARAQAGRLPPQGFPKSKKF